MLEVNSQLIKTDVTSVKIISSYIFAGIGSHLHIFHRNILHKKHKIFDGDKIHGISENNSKTKILLHGCNKLKVFEYDNNFVQFDEICCKNSNDWILTAKFIENDTKIASVSMNNVLSIWDDELSLEKQVVCAEKCILYSACICYDNYEDLVILSGTVFSEILIWRPSVSKSSDDVEVLKRLKNHNGVVFSLNYNEQSNYILSTSDDRSAILWQIKNASLLKELDQDPIHITVKCRVHGHLSRIFKGKVSSNFFITAGEDSFINLWSFDGVLLTKLEAHQGGPVWAIDCCEKDNIILSGGSDSAVSIFPCNRETEESTVVLIKNEVPKAVTILKSGNAVIVSEKGVLYYYNQDVLQKVAEHSDLKSYVIVQSTTCRKLFALAGFHGQIYVYKERERSIHQIAKYQCEDKSRIFSLHWLTCQSFLICQNDGQLTILFNKNNNISSVSKFILPHSKERWTTAACITGTKKLIVGDRKSNIYLYDIGNPIPIYAIRKSHNHLGITNLYVKDSVLTSLGRNSILKKYLLTENSLQLRSSDKVPFTWLVSIQGNLLIAFSGNNFVIWDYQTRRTIFEKPCGGGHRSWDFLKLDNNCSLAYIKDKVINISKFDFNKIEPIDVVPGYHVKEINSINGLVVGDKSIIISGSEDTTLKVTLLNQNNTDFINLYNLKSHLSSIRTITSFKLKVSDSFEDYLFFSGGGRAQIICWKLIVNLSNPFNSVCSEEHSYYEVLAQAESEMRIMDLEVTKINNQLVLFAACSDGNIKIFTVTYDVNSSRYTLELVTNLFYMLKCIIKLCILDVLNRKILVTMATDGNLVFWDVSDILNSKKDESEIKPITVIGAHQSGINSYSFKHLQQNRCLFLTGGDDSALCLNVLTFSKLNDSTIKIDNLNVFKDVGTHCAQITGVYINDNYFLTTSIDQRLALFRYTFSNDLFNCEFLKKYNSAVADIQGMQCFEIQDGFNVCLYGKGIEFVHIYLQNK